MSRIIEIRSYRLKPGARDAFHQLVTEQALPMLARWQVDVVRYGPSLHDDNSYYLIRSFASLEERQQREDSFYGSVEWRQGPREPILALIQTYVDTVIEVDDSILEDLRG